MNSWERLSRECNNCQKCNLANTRKNVVIGRGNREAPIMFIGEGPGEQEDNQGIPFVGPAGNLFYLLLEALMFKEEDYYIANIVKCRPPQNRNPLDIEAEQCMPFLRKQVALIRPSIIVCMGGTALKYIIDKDAKITQMRGKWFERKGCWLTSTFHPAALLRDKSRKIPMFEDFKKIKEKLDTIKS